MGGPWVGFDKAGVAGLRELGHDLFE
jgi:hypothetical protein